MADPALFGVLFSGFRSDDPVLRMRVADALEKITARHPEFLRPHKAALLRRVARLDQKEVRWHAAQMLPRVAWNKAELRQVLAVLEGYLTDRSSLVRTFAMQALTDLVAQAPELRPAVVAHVREVMVTGTPAMKARARKLCGNFENPVLPSAKRAG